MRQCPKTRRTFLQGVGSCLLALPVLPSLFTTARAGDLKISPRFLAVFSPRGRYIPDWYPSDNVLSMQELQAGVLEMPLASINGPISTILGNEMDPFRSKLLLLRGLDAINGVPGQGHWAASMLNGYFESVLSTNTKYLKTIDNYMAQSKAVYPESPALRALHLMVDVMPRLDGLDHLFHISIDSVNGQPRNLSSISNPHYAFDQVFGSMARGNAITGYKKSIVDSVYADLKALERNPRLSQGDRRLLDEHMTHLREVERRLALSHTCPAPARPSIKNDNYEPLDIPDLIRLHSDLIIAAFRCGYTKIATLMLEAGDHILPFVSGTPNLNHHAISHGEVALTVPIDQWYSKQVAYLLEKLDVVEHTETEATYLDNTLVFWGSEYSNGKTHQRYDMPVLLAGGDTTFRLGRFIDYRRRSDFVGVPYNDFLISLMQGMGLTYQEWELPGEEGFGEYKSNRDGRVYNLSDRRSGLKGLK